jgi:trans-aconitate methyltransferase
MDGRRESLAADYGAKTAAFYAAAQRAIIDALPEDRQAAILDLACGAGATGALALRDGKCATYVGIEEGGAAAGEARFAITDVVVGKLESVEIPYPPASFDVLICGAALGALADPEALLGRLVPLLRPGARVFATLPAGSRHDWARLVKRAGLRLDRPRGAKRRPWFAALLPRKPQTGDLTAHKPWR